jgi:hypothetical protein
MLNIQRDNLELGQPTGPNPPAGYDPSLVGGNPPDDPDPGYYVPEN